MRHHHSTITRHDIHRLVLDRLTTHLRRPDHSPRCPAAVVLQVVRAAAARLCSIAAAGRQLATAPSGQTVRIARADGLPGRDELERRLNRALAADLPRSLAGTRLASGPRPDPPAVPRGAVRGGGRGVPQPGQGRDHPLARLRHRVPRPARPARGGALGPRRGGRVVRLGCLRFKALLLWLLHVVEEQFGRWDVTQTERRRPRGVGA